MLTLLMPCLNERQTIGECVRIAIATLKYLNIDGEVLVADNRSSDGSPEIAAAAGARVINIEQRGYGAALIGGIHAAKGDMIIMGDCDLSYDFGPENIQKFVSELQRGAELVMGNRFKGGIAPNAMPLLHQIGTPAMTLVFNLMYRTRMGDLNCGMRGFQAAAIRRLNLQSPGMEFASEMLVRAAQQRLRITEIPTPLAKDQRDGKPHLKSFRDGWRHVMLWLKLYGRRSEAR